ncbi:MAG: type IV pilin protein [Gammaproteobacteria bacterium]
MVGRRNIKGLTLLELIVVLAVIGVLSSLAMISFNDFSVKAQVAEGLTMAPPYKMAVVEYFMTNGDAPKDRQEAGLTPNQSDSKGNYISSLNIVNGVLDMGFGNDSSSAISGKKLTHTPYESEDLLSVTWRCGQADAPDGLKAMGTSSGQTTANYIPSNIDKKHLPNACK